MSSVSLYGAGAGGFSLLGISYETQEAVRAEIKTVRDLIQALFLLQDEGHDVGVQIQRAIEQLEILQSKEERLQAEATRQCDISRKAARGLSGNDIQLEKVLIEYRIAELQDQLDHSLNLNEQERIRNEMQALRMQLEAMNFVTIYQQ